MAGLDDNFMGKFLLIGNIGFLILSQTSRLFIGSLHGSLEYQILTGIRKKGTKIFWPIFMATILFVFGFAFGSIIIKMFLEKLKERKLQKQLKVKLHENISTIEAGQTKLVQNPERNLIKFNNSKHNVPLWNGIQFDVIGAGPVLSKNNKSLNQNFNTFLAFVLIYFLHYCHFDFKNMIIHFNKLQA